MRFGLSRPYRNWELNSNFRNQDYDAEKYVQYASPKYQSTDSVVVAMLRLFVEHARDLQRRREREEELPEAP